MQVVVAIDLSAADLTLFDAYEAKVLPLLADYGARLEMRLRAKDGARETHILFFPSAEARQGYLCDPRRLALRGDWERSGAKAQSWEAAPLS